MQPSEAELLPLPLSPWILKRLRPKAYVVGLLVSGVKLSTPLPSPLVLLYCGPMMYGPCGIGPERDTFCADELFAFPMYPEYKPL